MAKVLEHKLPDLLAVADALRTVASRDLDANRRVELGQFLTPAPTARLMASMFGPTRRDSLRLLDAGAGVGTLTAAWVDEICRRAVRPKRITAVAYEVDTSLVPYLEKTLDGCRVRCGDAGINLTTDVRVHDFIDQGVEQLQMSMFAREPETFDYAIVNPPYRKVRSDSHTRALLRSIGIEATNLYTAFLTLIIRLLGDEAELVMITPRSFCNGPYFRPFRREYLGNMSTQRVHIYDSRKSAFKDDDVLQESVIFHAVKNSRRPRYVLISSSHGPSIQESTQRQVLYTDFVSPTDPDSFIHIVPDEDEAAVSRKLRSLPASLESLDISVSTGRVVDFRAREWLRAQPADDTAPLIYPTHFDNGSIEWPRVASKKPNAIVDNASTSDLLIPNGHYVLVKRFSAKEERRRVVAAIYDPGRFPCRRVGFENHLNYFHVNGRGLDPLVARGLVAFLNSSHVDRYFRQFNGHTQVNANDLRSLRYPSLAQLMALGSKFSSTEQSALDTIVERAIPSLTLGAARL